MGITAVALAACLLAAGYLFLPKLVTNQLPTAAIQRLGIADFSGQISHVGWYRTLAGPFVFGHADRPALAIETVTLNYTPGGLRRKTIRRIRMSNVVINASLGPEGIAFPGVNLDALAQKVSASPSSPDPSFSIGAAVFRALEIRGGMINLTRDATTYRIPFEADVLPAKTGLAIVNAHVRLTPRDQPLELNVQVDMRARQGRVGLIASAIALGGFTDRVGGDAGVNATGRATVAATAVLKWAPFAISNANVDLIWRGGQLTYASTILEPAAENKSVFVSASSNDLRTWRVNAGGMLLQTPAPITVNTLTATVTLAEGVRHTAGTAELTVLPYSSEHPIALSIKNRVSLPIRFDLTQHVSGDWKANLRMGENRRREPRAFLDLQTAGDPNRLELNAQGNERGGSARWQLNVNTILATKAEAIVKLPSAGAEGTFQFELSPHGLTGVGDVRVRLPTPMVEGLEMIGKLDGLNLDARFEYKDGHASLVDARMQCHNGQFHHRSSGLFLSGGHLNAFFRSNLSAKSRNGTFSVDRIVYNQQRLGTIHGRVSQKKNAYEFVAKHESSLFPKMIVTCSGSIGTDGSNFPDAALTFQLPPYALPAGSSLGRFVPAAGGINLSGTLSAHGKGAISRNGISASLNVGMVGGMLTMAEKKLVVEGIDTTLRFPELPRIRSAPAQQLRFSRAAMGGIVFDGGTVDFQVESQKTLFVEQGRLLWCDGIVDTQSLRISSEKQDYQVSLFCQRLALSRILEQLGSVNAHGTGTVNGRIPIMIRNGSIHFDDGFLFSTPGEGGRIQLTGTDMLTRGIPTGTPQFAQVDLAREALKDYVYTWAKLGLISDDEDFVMRLQFDGKPANPLPFVYKKEMGRFVRVRAGAQGSVFQGIALDVNLRLPLNQLLQYKDIVNMIK